MNQAFSSVIFDFGGVVVDWNPQRIVAEFYADPQLQRAALEGIFGHPDWLEIDRGALLETEAVERFAARMGRPAEEMVRLMENVKRSLKPNQGTVELLHDLVGEGYVLFGLSNMAVATFEYLERSHGFWPVFSGIVISGKVRMVKPQREIFEYLLDTHGLRREECVFIDDLPANVGAAAAAGIRSIRFDDAQQCRRDLQAVLKASRSAR